MSNPNFTPKHAENFLLCVDSDMFSLYAAQRLFSNFLKKEWNVGENDKLFILHVSSPVINVWFRDCVTHSTLDKMEKKSEKLAKKLLLFYAHLSEEFASFGDRLVLLRAIGTPSKLIHKAVEFYNISFVCIGKGGGEFDRRGNPIVSKLFLGSVCKEVVDSVDCCVLVVKCPPIYGKEDIVWTKEMLRENINCEKSSDLFTKDNITKWTDASPFAHYRFNPPLTEMTTKKEKAESHEKEPKDNHKGSPETKPDVPEFKVKTPEEENLGKKDLELASEAIPEIIKGATVHV